MHLQHTKFEPCLAHAPVQPFPRLGANQSARKHMGTQSTRSNTGATPEPCNDKPWRARAACDNKPWHESVLAAIRHAPMTAFLACKVAWARASAYACAREGMRACVTPNARTCACARVYVQSRAYVRACGHVRVRARVARHHNVRVCASVRACVRAWRACARVCVCVRVCVCACASTTHGSG